MEQSYILIKEDVQYPFYYMGPGLIRKICIVFAKKIDRFFIEEYKVCLKKQNVKIWRFIFSPWAMLQNLEFLWVNSILNFSMWRGKVIYYLTWYKQYLFYLQIESNNITKTKVFSTWQFVCQNLVNSYNNFIYMITY